MSNKILILGSAGMLGSDLVKVFSEYDIVGWDKKDIDLLQETEVVKKIKELGPQIIINAIAYTDVDGCESNREVATTINGCAVGYLAKAAKEIDATFVHYSTDYVFDGEKKDGYKEDDEPDSPANFYGQSKLLGEKFLKKNCEKYYLIRTAWLFGKNGKNFIDTILKLGKELKELRVVNDQHGKPTYTIDLARRTKELIEKKYPWGIYHITNDGETTWYDFAVEIFKMFVFLNPEETLGNIIPCDSSNFPRPAKRPAWSVLVNTKISPCRNWKEAVKEYLAELYADRN